MSIEERIKQLEERVEKLEKIHEESVKARIRELQSKIIWQAHELKAKGLPSFYEWIKGDKQ